MDGHSFPNNGHLWRFNATGKVAKYDHVTDTARMVRMATAAYPERLPGQQVAPADRSSCSRSLAHCGRPLTSKVRRPSPMATLRSLNSLLDDAAKILDQAAAEIRDVPLKPTGDNIQRVGEALSAIHAIQYQICVLDPALTPRFLSEPSDKPIIALAYALNRAREFQNAGEIETAIAFLRLFLAQGGTPAEREVATNEIAKLQRRDA
jgi:hypothetical protein